MPLFCVCHWGCFSLAVLLCTYPCRISTSLLLPTFLHHAVILLLGLAWGASCPQPWWLLIPFSTSHLVHWAGVCLVPVTVSDYSCPSFSFNQLLINEMISFFLLCIWQPCGCTCCKSLSRGNLAKTWKFGYTASLTHLSLLAHPPFPAALLVLWAMAAYKAVLTPVVSFLSDILFVVTFQLQNPSSAVVFFGSLL